jgi:hypothetical protein
MPSSFSMSAAGTSMVGRPSALSPCSKVRRAVSAAASAFARPCRSAVASVASVFFASLISAPPRAECFEISDIGRVVNSFRNRPTSASSVFRHICQ